MSSKDEKLVEWRGTRREIKYTSPSMPDLIASGEIWRKGAHMMVLSVTASSEGLLGSDPSGNVLISRSSDLQLTIAGGEFYKRAQTYASAITTAMRRPHFMRIGSKLYSINHSVVDTATTGEGVNYLSSGGLRVPGYSYNGTRSGGQTIRILGVNLLLPALLSL